jgi:hypothetical protein
LKHMGTGLKGRKGRVHFAFGKPISNIDYIDKIANKNDQFTELGKLIDQQIHTNYKLWPGNYIACDYLGADKLNKDKYTEAEYKSFHDYISEHIDRIPNPDRPFIMDTLMEMYANPVRNSQ